MYNVAKITVEETRNVIRKLKRHKTPGPDGIPIDILKELSHSNMEKLTEVLNEWWTNEDMPEEALLARVVLIYKKGDTNMCENYRPISLLNTMYKIMAAILQQRIQKGAEESLQATQYGFRKKRSTADA
eukprot:10341164-Karenia_brevis.AAC.1